MSILQGYTEATSILNELFGRKKNKQKKYHHLNRDEIKEIVAICKRNIIKVLEMKVIILQMLMYRMDIQTLEMNMIL